MATQIVNLRETMSKLKKKPTVGFFKVKFLKASYKIKLLNKPKLATMEFFIN